MYISRDKGITIRIIVIVTIIAAQASQRYPGTLVVIATIAAVNTDILRNESPVK